MTRKRIRHEQIPNESNRNATFEKRVDGLLKKANELSILCGVDIGIIVHKQGENNAILWPSPPIFMERLQNFLDCPDTERTRKMVTHEKYLEQIMSAETENLLKSKNRTQSKESRQLMNELIQGKIFDELDLYQLSGLNSVAEEMLKKLQKRNDELNNGQEQVQLLPLLHPPPPSFLSSGQQQMGVGEASTLDFGVIGAGTSSQVPMSLENLRNDQWFIETMSQEQNITSFLRAPPNIGGAASSVDGGGGVESPLHGMDMPPPPNNDSAS
ncbi:hypothetical protein Pfo_004002 [Paulownia fortunei]|nr:hypothetical protein Pfo_004002 [Paulownia fortunei]